MKRNNGFSLIELLIVLAIICIISSLIALNISLLSRARAHHEISLLYLRMTTLQHRAIASGQAQHLQFFPDEHSYAWQGMKHQLAKTVRFGCIAEAKGPPSAPTTVISSAITFAHNQIAFYPDGIIQPGAVYLVDNYQQCYALSSGVSEISFLRKYRYDKGTWRLVER